MDGSDRVFDEVVDLKLNFILLANGRPYKSLTIYGVVISIAYGLPVLRPAIVQACRSRLDNVDVGYLDIYATNWMIAKSKEVLKKLRGLGESEHINIDDWNVIKFDELDLVRETVGNEQPPSNAIHLVVDCTAAVAYAKIRNKTTNNQRSQLLVDETGVFGKAERIFAAHLETMKPFLSENKDKLRSDSPPTFPTNRSENISSTLELCNGIQACDDVQKQAQVLRNGNGPTADANICGEKCMDFDLPDVKYEIYLPANVWSDGKSWFQNHSITSNEAHTATASKLTSTEDRASTAQVEQCAMLARAFVLARIFDYNYRISARHWILLQVLPNAHEQLFSELTDCFRLLRGDVLYRKFQTMLFTLSRKVGQDSLPIVRERPLLPGRPSTNGTEHQTR